MSFKIRHDPNIDYVSIDFKDEIEAKSYFKDGVIIREDKKGQVIGIDITNSSKFFQSKDTISLQEACRILGISESTMRRKIRNKEIACTKPNGKDYRFKKSDVLGLR
jgi:excisionase family DNA binding protein